MTIEKGLNGKQKIVGTLLPLFSLPNKTHPHRSGTFAEANDFLDWLHRTGQHAWQMLPLHQTQLIQNSRDSFSASPYKGYGIGLDPKYLAPASLVEEPSQKELTAFQEEQSFWLEDYALFCALRDHFGTDDWTRWETVIQSRQPEAITYWRGKLAPSIRQHVLMQYHLNKAYNHLRIKAKKKNIILIGDTPYYLSIKSPLVWRYQHAFLLSPDGSLPKVSGIPGAPGIIYGRQVWGHPLYDWQKSTTEDVLHLWKNRLQFAATLFDIIRIDHTNGFFFYGELDLNNEKKDRQRRGPGLPFFEQIIDYAKNINLGIIAEDQGVKIKDLRGAMKQLHIPGIRILLYTIHPNTARNNPFEPYPHNTVAYTTTHDTETLFAFIKTLSVEQKKEVATIMHIPYLHDIAEFTIALRQAVIDAPSKIVIIPLQDWLLSHERINIPGTEKEVGDTNWQYKLPMPIEDLPNITY